MSEANTGVTIVVGTCFRPLSGKQIEKAREKGLDKWPDEVAQVFPNGLILNEGVPLFHGDPLWFIWHYLHIKPNLFPPGTSSAWVFECGKPTWEAYTMLVAKATAMKAKYLMVIEDDVFIPQATIHRLFRYLEKHPECGAVGGLYAWRHQPEQGEFFQMYKDAQPVVNIPDNETVDVDAAGLGCLMLRMDAVNKAKEHGRLFDDPFEVDGLTAHGGDLCLQHRIKQAGYAIAVDTGIKCWHRDPYTGTFFPQELRDEHGYPERPMIDFCQPTQEEALEGVLDNAAIKGPEPSPHDAGATKWHKPLPGDVDQAADTEPMGHEALADKSDPEPKMFLDSGGGTSELNPMWLAWNAHQENPKSISLAKEVLSAAYPELDSDAIDRIAAERWNAPTPEIPDRVQGEFTGAPDWDDIQAENQYRDIKDMEGPKALNVGWGGTPARPKLQEQFTQWVNHDGHDSEGTHLVSDCRDINAPTGAFDLVYVNHVLEHLTHAEGATALQEWWRLVKPGGRLFIGVPEGGATLHFAEKHGFHTPIYYLSDGTPVSPHMMLYGHPVGGAMAHKTLYHERDLRIRMRELFDIPDSQIISQPDELIPCGVKFIVKKE